MIANGFRSKVCSGDTHDVTSRSSLGASSLIVWFNTMGLGPGDPRLYRHPTSLQRKVEISASPMISARGDLRGTYLRLGHLTDNMEANEATTCATQTLKRRIDSALGPKWSCFWHHTISSVRESEPDIYAPVPSYRIHLPGREQ